MIHLKPSFSVMIDGSNIARWIDPTHGLDSITKQINGFLEEYNRVSNYGDPNWENRYDWYVEDYYDLPNLGKIDDLEILNTLTKMTLQYGRAYILWVEENEDYKPDHFIDSYICQFDSITDFGKWFVHSSIMHFRHKIENLGYNILDFLSYDKFGESLMTQGFYCLEDHYFRTP